MTESDVSNIINSNLLEVNTSIWANGRHIVRCARIIRETQDVLTFCFMAEQPMLFFFKPGQFVTLELEIDGASGSQALSSVIGLLRCTQLESPRDSRLQVSGRVGSRSTAAVCPLGCRTNGAAAEPQSAAITDR